VIALRMDLANRLCFIAMMAATKKVLSPISVINIMTTLLVKAGMKPELLFMFSAAVCT
jgi:hypothetical protein